MRRREFLGGLTATALLAPHAASRASAGKGVMLMNRIAPSVSELFVANSDGTEERRVLSDPRYDYNGSFSADGRHIYFTSERNGDGQSDLFRANADGSGIRQLVATASMEDAGVVSPDGRRLAYVSTANGYRANIWVMDLASGRQRQLTGIGDVRGTDGLPDCYFRPSWSPDGRLIAFSSDRNTSWRGHSGTKGWEHTQELAIFVIGADGSNFRTIAAKPGWCLGSPKWSADGRRIIFYEMTVEDTWGARRPQYIGKVQSQIVSVDVHSGDRIVHTEGPGLKVQPQFIGRNEIGWLWKGGPDEGLYYSSGRAPVKRPVRSPFWSADGRRVIYEKTSFKPIRPLLKPLYSWDQDHEYRHMDVFPVLSRDGWVVFTEKQLGNSSIVIMRPDGTSRQTVYDAAKSGLDQKMLQMGLGGAFQPGWSPDGQWIVFGLGYWFFLRDQKQAQLWRIRRDGTGLEQLTDNPEHSGFPSWSADGREIVYRVWSDDVKGLRILDLATRQSRVLTNGYDNLPGWSPDGRKIVFTRKGEDGNFDVFTIRPDGSDLFRATTHGSSDGHAVWTADNRILWSGSEHGFRDEAALYDDTFQQYGQIYIMNADGTGKRLLTDSKWEDSMPLYLPR